MKKLILLAGALGAAAAHHPSPATAGDDSAYHVQYEEADFLADVRRLTYQGARAGEGYFSPDGTRMVLQSERDPANPFFQIYDLDLDMGGSTLVSPGTGKTTCAFIQPGTGEVLFASTHLDPRSEELQREELEFRASGKERRYSWDYDVHYDLFVTRGGEYVRLTDAHGYDAEGSYSPDGKLIVFCSMREGYRDDLTPDEQKRLEIDPSYFGDIYLMNSDGTGLRRLTSTPGYDGGPFFTPDGERIVWRRFDEEGFIADVYTMKLDGTDERRLTDFGCMSWAPYFHPSGKYAAFASNKQGFSNFEVYLVDAMGEKEPVRVTYTDGFDGLPVFSPDGRGLSWTSTRHGGKGGQIFMATWNHEMAMKALADAPPRRRHSEKKHDGN